MRRRVLPSAVVNGYLALAALFAVWACVAAFRDHLTVAFQDDWRILDDLYSKPLREWLFTDQNGHWVPATLLLLFVDLELWSGRMHLLVLASLACALGSVGALWLALGRGECRADPGLRVLLGFSGFALFWAGSRHDFLWGMNQGSQLAVLWFLLAVAFLLRSRSAAESGSRRWLWLAVLAAALASFSHGVGLASFAALGAVALVGRLRARAIGAVTFGALLCGAAYGLGLRRPTSELAARYRELLLDAPLGVLEFATSFAGADAGWWARGLGLATDADVAAVSAVAGGLGAALLGVHAALLLRQPERARAPDLTGLALMVFGITAGFTVALNRLLLSEAHATALRFTTWSTLFWVGLVLALPGLLRRLGLASGEGRGLARPALLLGLSLSMLPALGDARASHRERRQRVAISALIHLLGIQSDPYAGGTALERDPARVYRVAARLASDRRNLFADPRAGLPGQRLAARFSAAAPSRCAGELGAAREIPSRGAPAASFRGWAWDLALDRRPDSVVLADSAGVIRGLGDFVLEPGERRWLGFVADFDAAERYTAYAVTEDERACGLGSTASPRAPGLE